LEIKRTLILGEKVTQICSKTLKIIGEKGKVIY